MPPKGWRKNAEGQYPQPNKDSELVSIDDILFPKTTIQKLAKAILEDDNGSNLLVAKDSVLAMQRAATVFVSHLLFYARQLSKVDSRKVVSAQDIFNALEQTDFAGFLPEVKQKLAIFEANTAAKKVQKVNKISVSDIINDAPVSKKLKDNNEQRIDVKDIIDDEEIVEDDDTQEAEEKNEEDDIEEDDEEPNAPEELQPEEAEMYGIEKEKENPQVVDSSDEE